jgi:hypothetical protein
VLPIPSTPSTRFMFRHQPGTRSRAVNRSGRRQTITSATLNPVLAPRVCHEPGAPAGNVAVDRPLGRRLDAVRGHFPTRLLGPDLGLPAPHTLSLSLGSESPIVLIRRGFRVEADVGALYASTWNLGWVGASTTPCSACRRVQQVVGRGARRIIKGPGDCTLGNSVDRGKTSMTN